jgi:hypothetical protein
MHVGLSDSARTDSGYERPRPGDARRSEAQVLRLEDAPSGLQDRVLHQRVARLHAHEELRRH